MNENNIIPVPVNDLCERYLMDIRSGYVYEKETNTQLPIRDDEDDNIYVVMYASDGQAVKGTIGELIILAIYGRTNSGPNKKITQIPVDTSKISPSVKKFRRIDTITLEINDIKYYRWKNTPYFVSEFGSVFSEKMNQWNKIHYDDKGYPHIATKLDGKHLSNALGRCVWETFRGDLGYRETFININGHLWDCSISNLSKDSIMRKQMMSNPEKYHVFDEESLAKFKIDVLSDMSNKEIADKYGFTAEYVWKLRTGRTTMIGLEGISEMIGNRDKPKPLNDSVVREVRQLHSDGESVKSISEKLNVGIQTIYQILKGQSYTNVI